MITTGTLRFAPSNSASLFAVQLTPTIYALVNGQYVSELGHSPDIVPLQETTLGRTVVVKLGNQGEATVVPNEVIDEALDNLLEGRIYD
jgi:hypothetical protein